MQKPGNMVLVVDLPSCAVTDAIGAPSSSPHPPPSETHFNQGDKDQSVIQNGKHVSYRDGII